MNWHLFKTAMKEAPARLPVLAQLVRVSLPEARKARTVHLLVSGRTQQVRATDGWSALSIESILDHEVVAIEL